MFSAAALVIHEWDHGLVKQELRGLGITPRPLNDKEIEQADGLITPTTAPSNRLKEGSFFGTQKALTEIFHRTEDRFRSYFDVLGIESSIPLGITDLEKKKELYQWQPRTGPDADRYPPHLHLIPKADDLPTYKIFKFMRLLDTGFVLTQIVPSSIKDFVFSHPDQGATLDDVWTKNHDLRKAKKNILEEPNIGDRYDWFKDAVFAQQSFTGTNPVTIESASDKWIKDFTWAAEQQGNKKVLQRLNTADKGSFYVQDCSYFRDAIGDVDHKLETIMVKGDPKIGNRYATATVTLFHLPDSGQLHPLAIIIDFKKSIQNSVAIFNKRIDPSEDADQARDWPWRFAKSCAQSADWIRHEVTVHLNDTHLVEEAVIVAAHRTLPTNHLVYRALEPHWLKTLPLNANARSTLVPHVVTEIIGMPSDKVFDFLLDAYKRFDWQKSYVPADLERRGFPVADLNTTKMHNYAYARDIYIMWIVLRKFVAAFLRNEGGRSGFRTDADVAKDDYIKNWSKEMRADDKGSMPSFPDIKTLDQLVDAVTMCIHIASPQHTAVNYLQEYYQAFVINKPPAICRALPKTLDELMKFTETDLMNALPINRPQEWLLASHLVHLLNSRVADEQNLVNYAASLYRLAKGKEPGIAAAAMKLLEDLQVLGDTTNGAGERIKGVFSRIADDIDDKLVTYQVMDPVATAVSILI